MTTATPSTSPTCCDALQLVDVDHVRFYVGNAKQAAFFYAYAFGFQVTQFRDLTSGCRESASYLLTQGNIRFILETPITPLHPATAELAKYGDGVKDVAFTVTCAEKAYDQAMQNGGTSVQEPTTTSDEYGSVTIATIQTYGRAVHSFVSRTGEYSLANLKQGGTFMPGFKPMDFTLNEYNRQNPCGLKYVDHCVGNVEEGKMNSWVSFYENVLEFSMFKHFDDNDISTEHSALMSKVMASGNHLIKMPINEPADGLKKSQILEYLEWHDMTPGIQHLALRTDDELASVKELRRRGVDFLEFGRECSPERGLDRLGGRGVGETGLHECAEDRGSRAVVEVEIDLMVLGLQDRLVEDGHQGLERTPLRARVPLRELRDEDFVDRRGVGRRAEEEVDPLGRGRAGEAAEADVPLVVALEPLEAARRGAPGAARGR